MKKVFLQVPYKQKEAAKSLGAKWDASFKEWYYEGEEVPEVLKRWTKCIVVVEPEDKEAMKSMFPSLKFNPKTAVWEASKEDFEKMI